MPGQIIVPARETLATPTALTGAVAIHEPIVIAATGTTAVHHPIGIAAEGTIRIAMIAAFVSSNGVSPTVFDLGR